jgi:protein phosphatase
MKMNINTDICSATDTGLVRERNEDNCGTAETPNGTVCVVCDGMGGHAGGQEASRIAVDCIIQHLSRERYADIRLAMRDALDFANMQILGAAAEHPELQGMGTTACVVVFQDDKAWIAHAGDSRIYLFVAKEKRLHRLTRDHSFVQGLVEQGVIYPEEAENHPDKNRILKALGIKEDLNPEIPEQPVLPAKGDIFLICSDGLSGMVADKEIEDILATSPPIPQTSPPTPPHKGGAKYSNGSSLQAKETALMSAAKAAGGTDNITFQLVKISRSPHRKSVFKDLSPALPKTCPAQAGREGAIPLQNAKYIIIAAFAIICLLAGIWIGASFFNHQPSNETGQPNITVPSDSSQTQTKPASQLSLEDTTTQDTVPDNHSNPLNPVNQGSDIQNNQNNQINQSSDK